MPEFTSLDHLHQHYAALALQPPHRASDDEHRSLHFYRVETTSDWAHGTASADRVSRWVHHILQVDEFVQQEHRLPRENNRVPRGEVDVDEQRLADWIRYQRRPATQALHCSYQQSRLECVPGFSWSPLDDQWNARFAEYATFVGRFHRPPRYRSRDAHERAMAAWAAKQRHFVKTGTLPQERQRKLNSLSFRVAATPGRPTS